MAYLQEDEETKAQGLNETLAPATGAPGAPAQTPEQPQAPQSSQPSIIGAGSTTPTPAARNATPSTQANAKAGSGNFTNLKKYLTANQGNRISGAASQKVANLATGAQKGIAHASTAFGTKVDQGSLANRRQALTDVQNTVNAARGIPAAAPASNVPTPPGLDKEIPTAPIVEAAQAQQAAAATGVNSKPPPPPKAATPAAPVAPAAAPAPVFDQNAYNSLMAPTGGSLAAKLQGVQNQVKAAEMKKQFDTDTAAYNAKQAAEQSAAAAKASLLESVAEKKAAPEVSSAAEAPIEQGAQYLTDEQQSRFADIINAKYSGPESIRQAGLLEPAQTKVKEAARQGKNAETAMGREELLRSMFGQNRDYSRGQNKLDSLLLNTSAQGVGQLKQAAQGTQQLNQNLAKAENESQNLSTNRAKEIADIRGKGRSAFETGRTSEEVATEKRMTDLIETPVKDANGNVMLKTDGTPMTEWDRLPEHFRASLQNKVNNKQDQWELSPEEAAILGVSAGEGLYNTQASDIKTTAADRQKLITQNEFARQQALSQLAGLDKSNALQKELKYTNQDLAGTQNLNSSLDTDAFRNQLNQAQQNFEDSAAGTNIVGEGSKKVSRGNAFGKKTKTYYAEQAGNAADMLRQGGYDINNEGNSQARSILGDQDMVNRLFAAGGNALPASAQVSTKAIPSTAQAMGNYLGATGTSRSTDAGTGFSGVESGAKGAATGAALGSVIPGVGTAIGGAVGGALGTLVGTNTFDSTQAATDILKELDEKYGIKGLGAVGQGVQDVRAGVGNAIKNLGGGGVLGDITQGIGGMVAGIDTKAMKELGDSVAKENALADLKTKYANYLTQQGFANRANVADNATTQARTSALRDLLSRKG